MLAQFLVRHQASICICKRFSFLNMNLYHELMIKALVSILECMIHCTSKQCTYVLLVSSYFSTRLCGWLVIISKQSFVF